MWESYSNFCQPSSLDPSLEFCLLELALKKYCSWMIQNEMFHLLFIYFQVTKPTYTFVPSHLLIHFRGFVITCNQGRPTIFHAGDFTHNKLLHEFLFKVMMIFFSLLMICWCYFLDLWHQWQPHSIISPFIIDGNTHAPPIIMFIFFLSPFDINAKGNTP